MDILRGERLAEAAPESAEFTSSVADDAPLINPVVKINMAHMLMLAKKGYVKKSDASACLKALASLPKKFKMDPNLEDVHMNVESFVIDRAGADAGGQLNLAKSRNDQVATAIRMTARERVLETVSAICGVSTALVSIAKKHSDWVMPGYTHLQHAQPTTLAHHMLAHNDAMLRNAERLLQCYSRVNQSPMGAAALGSVVLELDRDYIAKMLGLDSLVQNTMDAVSSRDFAIEIISLMAITMADLSRLAEEIILWSSSEFSFAEVSDEHASTSSIMPQKKNPVVAEMIRSRTAIVIGDLVAALSLVRALPLTYNLDLQDLTPKLWDACKNTIASLKQMASMLKGIKFDKKKLESSAETAVGAADLANYIAAYKGIPFRTAHKIVGALAKEAAQNKDELSKVAVKSLIAVAKRIAKKEISLSKKEIETLLNAKSNINRKASKGSPSSRETAKMVQERTKRLSELMNDISKKMLHIEKADASLMLAVEKSQGGD
ncbi:MAG: argininosuccinate lyase [Thaumarchaeota archaeon]|nr:argininosuccinate lyase [Nitrososphaerota archaeon]